MRLSEIKSELKDRIIDFSDCFDKESMVQKLVDARANNIDNSSSDLQDDKEKEIESASDDRKEESPSSSPNKAAASDDEPFDREKALEELKGMRVRELREELGRRRIPRAGLFEKEDLVNALVEARAIASVYSGTGRMTPGEVSEFPETDVQTEMDHPGTLLLLDVYATWCGPCQMIAPLLKEIAAEEGDKLRIVKMDSDQNQGLASKLKVSGLPTLVLFKGGEEIDRLEGAPTKEQLMGWIDSRR
jgi:thioredoxin 1